MTKIDIFSGFLGAGKTTLIKKLVKEAYAGENLVLIENEFGEIGVDGGFLSEAGIKINELNSGCICCSLVGDFAKALKKVYEEYSPDRILIEPSGVGKLSDVIRAVESAGLENCVVNSFTTVVDANKCKLYMKNFGEFFNDQIDTASCIIFSHADMAGEEKLSKAVALVRERNSRATVVTTPLSELSGEELLAAIEGTHTLAAELAGLLEEEGHHHDDEDEHEEHCHPHHHDDEDEHEEHCHHHHDDEEEEHEGHCHHHEGEEHHHHHHADDVFSSWGAETGKAFTRAGIEEALSHLADAVRFGTVLRAKGIVAGEDGKWLHFDYVPGETDVREGAAAYTGRICVIGSALDEDELKELFGV